MDPLQEMVSNFNPHHHAGGDTLIPDHKGATKYFNPHHHAGGDNTCANIVTSLPDFNPHHHAGGDDSILLQDNKV